MTKEPIIIDGVDVNKCEFYNKVIGEDAYCNIDEEHLCTCISYNNCYYKQLKRKEQECEMLKYGLGLANSYVNKYFQALQDIKSLCLEQNLKADFFACEILQKCEVIND